MNDKNPSDVVLVVDDSPETLRMLTDALDRAGMTVMVALDGSAAMKVLGQITPDIILLDAVMPGLDGFETCRRLKREARLSNVPVVFMTGLSDTEHIVRGLEAGGVDYVTKPVKIEEMLARIRVHLTNARMATSARTALDVAGHFLFAVSDRGQLIWATPQTHKLLSHPDSGTQSEQVSLPEAQLSWLERARQAGTVPPSGSWDMPGGRFALHYLGRPAAGEHLLRLTRENVERPRSELRKELGLTTREAEVLSWLSNGKTNRDIAQILGLSPRTIDKHLEQIYAKLGVENRTAAATIAVKALTRDHP
jgi:DNA-binding response OmpR family regulator/DNA-binding CsgD family transcriptional regulator